MMRAIALRIPADERRTILLENLVNKAVAQDGNKDMNHLMIIWKHYVEPTLNPTCNLCYQRVLENYRALHQVFIELEKENSLLDDN